MKLEDVEVAHAAVITRNFMWDVQIGQLFSDLESLIADDCYHSLFARCWSTFLEAFQWAVKIRIISK